MLITLIIVGSSLWVLIDAKRLGIRKGLVQGLANLGPWGWFWGSLLLWIIVFPLYLFRRVQLKALAAATRSQGADAAPVPVVESSSSTTAIGWAVLGIAVVGIGIAAIGGGSNDAADTKAAEAPAATFGQPIRTEKFEITFQSAKLRKLVGNEFLNSRPADGGIYLAIKYSIRNISDKPVGSFRLPGSANLSLLDPQGTRYSTDAAASGYYAVELDVDTKVFSDLNPGIAVSEAAVFEVAADRFDPHTWRLLLDADRDLVIALPPKGKT